MPHRLGHITLDAKEALQLAPLVQERGDLDPAPVGLTVLAVVEYLEAGRLVVLELLAYIGAGSGIGTGAL